MMGDSTLGRKWPLVLDLVLCAALSVATGFVKDFHSFLAVRSLFGICMGGICEWQKDNRKSLQLLKLSQGVLQTALVKKTRPSRLAASFRASSSKARAYALCSVCSKSDVALQVTLSVISSRQSLT